MTAPADLAELDRSAGRALLWGSAAVAAFALHVVLAAWAMRAPLTVVGDAAAPAAVMIELAPAPVSAPASEELASEDPAPEEIPPEVAPAPTEPMPLSPTVDETLPPPISATPPPPLDLPEPTTLPSPEALPASEPPPQLPPAEVAVARPLARPHDLPRPAEPPPPERRAEPPRNASRGCKPCQRTGAGGRGSGSVSEQHGCRGLRRRRPSGNHA